VAQELHADRVAAGAFLSSSLTIETIPIKLDLSPVRVLQQVLAPGLISAAAVAAPLLYNGVVCLSYIA
jgi:hypothetical protein